MLNFVIVCCLATTALGVVGMLAAISYSMFCDDEKAEKTIFKASLGAVLAGLSGSIVCGVIAAAKEIRL